MLYAIIAQHSIILHYLKKNHHNFFGKDILKIVVTSSSKYSQQVQVCRKAGCLLHNNLVFKQIVLSTYASARDFISGDASGEGMEIGKMAMLANHNNNVSIYQNIRAEQGQVFKNRNYPSGEQTRLAKIFDQLQFSHMLHGWGPVFPLLAPIFYLLFYTWLQIY